MTLDNSHSLTASAVAPFIRATREGRAKGNTLTIVNDATEARVTIRIRRPKGFGKAVLVDVMTGSDNETDFKFIGSIPLEGTLAYTQSKWFKAPQEKADFARKVLNWTFGAAAAGDLRTVRVLHEAKCARCGRKLTVPESIDSFMGPECRSHLPSK